MARPTKSKPSQEPSPRDFSLKEADLLTNRLLTRIEELRRLDMTAIRWDDPRVHALETAIRDTAGELAWTRSPEGAEWRHFKFARQRIVTDDEADYQADMQAQFVRNVPRVIVGLEALTQLIFERTIPEPDAIAPAPRAPRSQSRRVFVVHGHNEEFKQTVARTLEQLDLEPIILHEQADRGRTVIEKFEQSADVDFAVVLMSGDDFGGAKSTNREDYRPRARQNVLLELGYFVGKLGRDNVCVLAEAGLEMPSDYVGVLFKPYDTGGVWRYQLAEEIKAAGIDVDLNRLAKRTG